MKKTKCPVCQTPLTKHKYEHALGILKSREKHLKTAQHAQMKKLRASIRAAKQNMRKARSLGIEHERKRNQRLLAGKESEIDRLRQRIKNITKGTTPQTDGLEFEEKLLKALKRTFPEDKFDHVGKGGDIIQRIQTGNKEIGKIVFECKRTKGISSSHIKQANRAKQTRQCDFAVLNTTGTKKKFAGFSVQDDVIIASPLCVLAVANMLRETVLSMHRAEISRTQRAKVAKQLLSYLKSPHYRNLIGDLVSRSRTVKEILEGEMLDHAANWRDRWEAYQQIELSSLRIKENFDLILANRPHNGSQLAKKEVLCLPAPLVEQVRLKIR